MRIEFLLLDSPVDHKSIELSATAGTRVADPASERSGTELYAFGRFQKLVSETNRSVDTTVLGVASLDIVPSRGSQ